MKIYIHKAGERGAGEHGWLHTRHSFSFANYYNPERMNFGLLHVLNEDYIVAGRGFDTHAHNNMEIVTIVLEGALEHKDTSGGHGVLRPGEVQSMSAGAGVEHSEFNPSKTEQSHILQLWISTREDNIKPRYEQKRIELKRNKITLLASGKRKEDSVYIHQEAFISRGLLDFDKIVEYKLNNKGNGVFVFLIKGEVKIGDKILAPSDSAEITGAEKIEIGARKQSDLLLIEVPME